MLMEDSQRKSYLDLPLHHFVNKNMYLAAQYRLPSFAFLLSCQYFIFCYCKNPKAAMMSQSRPGSFYSQPPPGSLRDSCLAFLVLIVRVEFYNNFHNNSVRSIIK